MIAYEETRIRSPGQSLRGKRALPYAVGRKLYMALMARIPFLDIIQEGRFAYSGYEGMLELVCEFAPTIEAPV